MQTMIIFRPYQDLLKNGGYQHDAGTHMIQLNQSDPVGSHRRIVSAPTIRSGAENELFDRQSDLSNSLPTLPSEAYRNDDKSQAILGPSYENAEMQIIVEPRGAEMGKGVGISVEPRPVSPQIYGSPRIPNPKIHPYPDRSKSGNVPLHNPEPQVLHQLSRGETSNMIDDYSGEALSQTSSLQPAPHRPPEPLLLRSNATSPLDITPSKSRRHGVPSLERDWEKIKRLRNEVWGLRSRIHEMRKDLKEKQQIKSAADDRYFQFLRIHGTPSNATQDIITVPGSIMARLFYECEVARDVYGPLEDDCTLLENYLGSQELELQHLEEIFYSRESELSRPYPPPEDLTYSPQVSPTSSVGSELAMGRHPLLSQYFSKLGSVQFLRERLDDLVEQRYILEEEQETRARVGKELAESDQEWLRNYSQKEDAMIKEFEIAEEEATNLRQQCLDLGLIDEEGTPTDFETQEQYTFADDNLDPGSETSEYVKFPHLIPQPSGKDLEIELPRHEYDEGSEISNERISSWLLYRLRTSALEVKLLANIFEAACGKIEHGEKWQVDVLAFWFDDPMDSELKPRNPSSTGTYTLAPHDIPLPTSCGSEYNSNSSWGIIIKSSRIQPSDPGSNPDETEKRYRILLPITSTNRQFLSKSV